VKSYMGSPITGAGHMLPNVCECVYKWTI